MYLSLTQWVLILWQDLGCRSVASCTYIYISISLKVKKNYVAFVASVTVHDMISPRKRKASDGYFLSDLLTYLLTIAVPSFLPSFLPHKKKALRCSYILVFLHIYSVE